MKAAVPKYVGNDFKDAPPGHKFNLYFPVWDDNWKVQGSSKSQALKQTLGLPTETKKQIGALRLRQQKLMATRPADQVLNIEAMATSPFATGLGNEHPTENGFTFLNPYGIPYLSGSSIKGVLRTAARELLEFGRAQWSTDLIDELFGNQDTAGALAFFDAIPEIPGDSLAMEVMTPHYSKYYQGNEAPHDAGQPNPITFMVIPPRSRFSFYIMADTRRIKISSDWKVLVQSLMEHAFKWLGFGAKTTVGYGAFSIVSESVIAQEKANQAKESLKCEWVEEKIQELMRQNRSPEKETLRGKALAEAWQAITDDALKIKALVYIKSLWQAEGWWDQPPGGASKKAKNIYDGAL